MNPSDAPQQVDQQTQGTAGYEQYASQNLQSSQAPRASYQSNDPTHIIQQAKPFPVAKLLLIIFTPGILLFVMLIMQVLLKFLLSDASEGGGSSVALMIVNLVSIIFGTIAAIGFIIMPIAVILLIVKHNKK